MVMNAVDSFWGDYQVPTMWAGDRNGAQFHIGEAIMRVAEQATCKGDAYRKAMARGVAPFLPWMTGEVIEPAPAQSFAPAGGMHMTTSGAQLARERARAAR